MAGPTFNSTNATGDKYTATPVTSGAITIPGVVANDTIVVFVGCITHASPTLVPSSVVDGSQGAFTPQAFVNTNFNDSLACFTLQNATAGTHTVTINFATAVNFWAVWGTFSNPGGSYVDQSAAQFYSSANPISQTITDVQSNDTVISMLAAVVAVTAQSGTSFFNAGAIGVGCQGQYQAQSGSGAITPSFTFGAATYGNIIAISLQNSGGSGLSWIRA